MEEKKFNEVELQKKLYNNEITHLQYINKNTDLFRQEYLTFCTNKKLRVCEESAKEYLQYRVDMEKQRHVEGYD